MAWNDGICSGYGRGEDPDAPEYCFQRDVDFCSAAALFTRTKLFNRLGGFDAALSPAYYEDVDYCLRLWAAGYRVAYDPDIVTDHVEFGSSETREGALDQQRRNRPIFQRLRKADLESQLPCDPTNLLAARMRPHSRRRLLFLDEQHPGAAASLREGIEDLLTVKRLGLGGSSLERTLSSIGRLRLAPRR